MLAPGVYAASITPFDQDGKVDHVSVSHLMARLEALGCQGALVAGTNGEGGSLSAIERRDLAKTAVATSGKLEIILGLATSSLTEAIWLADQAAKAGVAALLVNPPCTYRTAPWSGVFHWFREFSAASPLPWMYYNFPKVFTYAVDGQSLAELAELPQFLGVKDSSGEEDNIEPFRSVLASEHRLFVGDERLLPKALEAGWTGTISGATNLIGGWIAKWMELTLAGKHEEANVKWELMRPAIEEIRGSRQPAVNKAVLHRWGVIPHGVIRPPWEAVDPEPVCELLQRLLGLR